MRGTFYIPVLICTLSGHHRAEVNSVLQTYLPGGEKEKNNQSENCQANLFLNANTLLLAEKIFVVVSPVLYLCTYPSG